MTEDICRRWTREVADLKSRTLKVQRREKGPCGEQAALLEDAFQTCDAMLQELAGLQLMYGRVRSEVQAEAANRQYLLQQGPPCLTTDTDGQIIDANDAAAVLLNISVKHMRGRPLLHFTENREAFGQLWQRVRFDGTRMTATIHLRPRERAPREIAVVIVPETPEDASAWLWFLLPSTMTDGALRDLMRDRATNPKRGPRINTADSARAEPRQ